jgi:hypothetical protein
MTLYMDLTMFDKTNGHFIHAGPFLGTGVSIYLSGPNNVCLSAINEGRQDSEDTHMLLAILTQKWLHLRRMNILAWEACKDTCAIGSALNVCMNDERTEHYSTFNPRYVGLWNTSIGWSKSCSRRLKFKLSSQHPIVILWKSMLLSNVTEPSLTIKFLFTLIFGKEQYGCHISI